MFKVSISFSLLPSPPLHHSLRPISFPESFISNAASKASVFEFLNLQMSFGPQAAALTQPIRYAAVVAVFQLTEASNLLSSNHLFTRRSLGCRVSLSDHIAWHCLGQALTWPLSQ